ncbi:MAG: GNAT family N-acetyltransferase [Planctomycetes bacterium]|nr:GNAT family N-acetyltransferase [Planctomycetota bacterium]
MPNVEVKPVETRREQKAFLQFAWSLYRDDPNWIPPLQQNLRELVGFRPHPFHEVADVQAWLARKDGQVCGRIATIVNHVHNRKYHEQRGFFGFFESVNDPHVAHALFDAARDWFAQRGIRDMRGPVNPSLNYEVGLLVEGFDSPPVFQMTYNPPYYAQLIESFGFQKAQDMYAFWGHIEMLSALSEKLLFIIRETNRRFNVKMRTLDRRHFKEDVRTFLDIYNASLEGSWGFTPLSDGEIEHISDGLRHLIVPELTSCAEVDGRPVGAAFGLLDYNPRIKQINGRLFPFGFIRLLTRRQQIKRIRLISTNVLPEFQRWGLGLALLAHLMPKALEWGITEAEFSWVLESNRLSYGSLKRGGAKLTKTYRVYDYCSPAEKPADNGR